MGSERRGDLTLTSLVAERVKTLRGAARLSGTALAAEMTKLGVSWNRSTVAKLESGRRESITLREWLALAKVLGVPPPWLLIDPRQETVPIAEGIEVNPWVALLWMVGDRPLTEARGEAWTKAAAHLGRLHSLYLHIKRYKLLRELMDDEPEEERAVFERKETSEILEQLQAFVTADLPFDKVLERAAELGVDLRDQGG